jgi:hypothetical protein
MSHPDAEHAEEPAWTEAQVDAELRQFFCQELPADLPAAPQSGAARTATPVRRATAAQISAVGTVAVLLLAAALYLGETPTERPQSTDGTGPTTRDRSADPPLSLDGSRRPVESPHTLQPVMSENPAKDDGILEWEIEVFPIDDPPSDADGPAVAEPAPGR